MLLFPACSVLWEGQGPKPLQASLLFQTDQTGLVLLQSVQTSSGRVLPAGTAWLALFSVISEAPDLVVTGGKSQKHGEVSNSQWTEEKQAL